MKKETKKMTIMISLLAVILIGAAVYFGSRGSDAPVSTGLQSATRGVAVGTGAEDVNEEVIGQEFLRLLSNIRNIDLDTSILVNPSFLELKDFDVEIVRLNNEGRTNPFAPIGFESTTSISLPEVTTDFNPQGGNITIEEVQ